MYIRVFSTTQHTSRFNNGAILEGGKVVSKDTITGSHNIYYWNSNEDEVQFATNVNFNSSNVLAAYAGSLFTIREDEKTNQCYKVESITFGDDGLIELSGSHVPLIDIGNGKDGKLAILNGWNSNGRFAFA